MNKRNALEKLQTGIIVTLISVLVWLYAEGEAVQTYNNQRVLVKLTPPAGQQLAILPREPFEILVSFKASSGEMSYFEDMLRHGPIQIEVGDDPDTESPEQTLVLKEELANTKVGQLGMNILSTNPPTKQVRVESLVTRTLPVEVADAPVQFAKPPLAQPAKVDVALPRSLAAAAQRSHAIARLDTLDFTQIPANSEQTVTVALELPEALESPFTQLAQPTVDVTFNIRKLTDTIRLANIPIRINADPLTLQDFEIDLNPSDMVLRDVRLSGPSDVIGAIQRGDVRVWAELRPTRDEAERGVSALTPVIVAPEGVTHDPPPPVPVTIRRR